MRTRVQPSLHFIAGTGDAEISCTVDTLDPTMCDPVGHDSVVFFDPIPAGGFAAFLITGGTVSLTNFNVNLVVTDLLTSNPNAPPISTTGACCTNCMLTLPPP
ncbi:hypothetical protein MYX76_18240 [Desulfobacterota bacterium AH_259_B03_O07]|nr:hypothetical protein [Desulfobacterota bacterium AH_259_B03_O07]